jgi:hypothetical protein
MQLNTTFKTGFSFDRPLWSYAKVNRIISAIRRNKRFFIRSDVGKKEYLDVGCGPNTHDGVINLDYGGNPKIDVY